jgi:hypothetical protein
MRLVASTDSDRELCCTESEDKTLGIDDWLTTEDDPVDVLLPDPDNKTSVGSEMLGREDERNTVLDETEMPF